MQKLTEALQAVIQKAENTEGLDDLQVHICNSIAIHWPNLFPKLIENLRTEHRNDVFRFLKIMTLLSFPFAMLEKLEL